ncbi:MAG: Rnase Y domain-containing protein [Oligoflexales bacterium]
MATDSFFSINLAYLLLSGLVLGYAFFLVLLKTLPRRLLSEDKQQHLGVIEKAKKRKEQIIKETKTRFEEQLALNREEINSQLADREQDLEIQEQELESLIESVEQAEGRIAKQEKDLQQHKEKVAGLTRQYEAKIEEVGSARNEMLVTLEKISELNMKNLKEELIEKLTNDRVLEKQKRAKDLMEDLETHGRRFADRMLSRLLSRYEPTFIWPKSLNHVELQDRRVLNALEANNFRILEELKELSEGVEIELDTEDVAQPTIRLGGGYGIYKEAVKLTLNELLTKPAQQWNRAAKVYDRHKQALNRQAEILGAQAVKELRVRDLHPEIQRMVGALNWRTSYRQNQFHHSLEVAKLAGILATELGLDVDKAKRCGLLHDIGKGIDYRIEGSHAVISADYADRFGEGKLICDTVMSHHNDLILDTPMSYVLKSADTLSGARPGARVNLEEGYQIRLSAIEQVVRSFDGIEKMAIMSGGREVHIEVNNNRIKENDLKHLTEKIAKKIAEEVAFPGQIKVLVSRKYEASAVA